MGSIADGIKAIRVDAGMTLSPSSHEEFEDIVIRAEDNVPFRVLGSLVWRQGAV